MVRDAIMNNPVFRYRVTDRPDWLMLIAPECNLNEAKRVLEGRFGKARLVAVELAEGGEESRMVASNAELETSASGGLTCQSGEEINMSMTNLGTSSRVVASPTFARGGA